MTQLATKAFVCSGLSRDGIKPHFCIDDQFHIIGLVYLLKSVVMCVKRVAMCVNTSLYQVGEQMAMFYKTVYAKYLNTKDPSMTVTLTLMHNWVNKHTVTHIRKYCHFKTYTSQQNSNNVPIIFFLYTFSPVQSVISI